MEREDSLLKILEQFIQGKENNPTVCEDGIFAGKAMAAVIDGVTAKGSRLWKGKTSGRYAMESILDFLEKHQEKVSEFSCPGNFFCLLNDSLSQCINSCCTSKSAEKELLPPSLHTVDRPRASIILYNDVSKEIWSYGDCQCSINGKVYTHAKEIDRLNSDLRAFYLEYTLLKTENIEELLGQTSSQDPGRQAILHNLEMQMTFENRTGPFGYPVLNGQGIEPALIKVYPVKPGDEVVLASDGYPVLKETLADSEKALQEILAEDPLCFRSYRSTKGKKPCNVSFDDRTYCRILVY